MLVQIKPNQMAWRNLKKGCWFWSNSDWFEMMNMIPSNCHECLSFSFFIFLLSLIFLLEYIRRVSYLQEIFLNTVIRVKFWQTFSFFPFPNIDMSISQGNIIIQFCCLQLKRCISLHISLHIFLVKISKIFVE